MRFREFIKFRLFFLSINNSIAKFDFYFFICSVFQLLPQAPMLCYNAFEYVLYLPICYYIFGVLLAILLVWCLYQKSRLWHQDYLRPFFLGLSASRLAFLKSFTHLANNTGVKIPCERANS